MTPDCHSSLPFARSKHMIVRRLSPLTACVTKTRSPHTIGEELPRSGNATRQCTFSLVLHFTGKFFSDDIPALLGPRQPGQFAASSEGVTTRTNPLIVNRANKRFITSVAKLMTFGKAIGFRPRNEE